MKSPGDPDYSRTVECAGVTTAEQAKSIARRNVRTLPVEKRQRYFHALLIQMAETHDRIKTTRTPYFVLPQMRMLTAYARCIKRGRMPTLATFQRRGLMDHGWIRRTGLRVGDVIGIERMDVHDSVMIDVYLDALRRFFISHFGFAVLCHETVEQLRPLSPLVEIGAGCGSWTLALRNAGLDIIATDSCTEYGDHFDGHGRMAEVEKLGGARAVLKYPERNVLCVWPSLNGRWAHDAVKAMAPTQTLALVGEGDGGCTGDAALFKLLEREFDEIAYHEMAHWPMVHDRLTIHRRK